MTLSKAVEDFERTFITEALVACKGNITHAAQRLGVYRSALQRKMRKLGIVAERPTSAG